MGFEFLVTVDDCEADCCQEDIRRIIEEAIAERMPFNTIEVQPAVATIRARYVLRCRINGARALGRELGVSDTTIRDALKQRTWKEN